MPDNSPGFLKKLSNQLSETGFSSSAGHRKTERGIILTQTAALTFSTYNLAPVVPAKFMQTLLSLYSLLRSDTKASEKIIHGMQATLTLFQTGLITYLLMIDETCESTNKHLECNLLNISELLLFGIIAAGIVPSEMSKGKPDELISHRALADDYDSDDSTPAVHLP